MFDRSTAFESGYHQNQYRDLQSTISSSSPRIVADGDLVGSHGIAGSRHLLRFPSRTRRVVAGSHRNKAVLGISRSPSSAFEQFSSAPVAPIIWGRDRCPTSHILGGPHGAQIPTNYNPPLPTSRGTSSSDPTSTTISPKFNRLSPSDSPLRIPFLCEGTRRYRTVE